MGSEEAISHSFSHVHCRKLPRRASASRGQIFNNHTLVTLISWNANRHFCVTIYHGQDAKITIIDDA